MIRKHRVLWSVLFAVGAILITSLVLGWNVVLISNYRKMALLARNFTGHTEADQPWTSITLGTLGLIAAMAIIILFFVKLLKEMKINQQQAEFLASISHELKTPIAAIDLSSSLIRAGGISEDEILRLWKTHDEELQRLRDEVETLLEAARWQSNHALLKNISIPLESWLEESFTRWRGRLGPHAVIDRQGDRLDDTIVQADLRTLNLITDNIVDNARKYSKGTPEVIIRTTKAEGGRWKIQFVDRGMGFGTDDSRQIFKRFFRGRNPTNHAIPGTGLGLYLAQSASRALGMHLKGESPGTGEGATFTLEGRERKT